MFYLSFLYEQTCVGINVDVIWKNLCFFFFKKRFRPRILIDVSKIDMTTTVLGFKISMPIMIAPTAMQKMAHPEGIPLFDLALLLFPLPCKMVNLLAL